MANSVINILDIPATQPNYSTKFLSVDVINNTAVLTDIDDVKDYVILETTNNLAITNQNVSLAYNTANSAYNQANNTSNNVTLAYNKANTAYDVAVAGYNQANNTSNIISLAYNTANAAFIKANTAFDVAVAAYNTANNAGGAVDVSSAYNTANAAFIKANTAFDVAVGAYNQANTASITANTAHQTANNTSNNVVLAYNKANTAFDVAVGAYNQANSAHLKANTFAYTANINFNTQDTISSSVVRELNAKLTDIISVKDFGAVGDGVTVDTTPIQAAINYANTVNKSLYFPSGRYLTDTLTIHPNINLIGEGKKNTTILCNANNISVFKYNLLTGNTAIPEIKYYFNFSQMNLETNSKINCTGIEITGANAYFSRCSNINIRDVDFWGQFDKGIYLSNTANIIIENVHNNFSNTSIYLNNPADCDIINCKAQLGNYYGILLTGEVVRPNEGVRIVSCSSNGQRGGLYVKNTAWGAAVGCSFTTTSEDGTNFNYPLYLENAVNWKFNSCEFASANTDVSQAISGAYVFNSENVCFNGSQFILNCFGVYNESNNTIINGCNFNAQGTHHIYSGNSVSLTINSNQFKNLPGMGLEDIYLEDNAKNVIVVGNNFRTIYAANSNNVFRLTSSSSDKIIGNVMAGSYSGFDDPASLNAINIGNS